MLLTKTAESNGKDLADDVASIDLDDPRHPVEGTVSLPLPQFNSELSDERTKAIEANLSRLAERLWKAEDHLEVVARSQEIVRTPGAEENPLDQVHKDGRNLFFGKPFPYPLSHAQPQSSNYPLSYPLGMGVNGPVLLGGQVSRTDDPIASFERYNDESGLSAQEELRLLKAQVQDIARVCKAVAFGDLTQHITVPVQVTSWSNSRISSIRWSIASRISPPKSLVSLSK